MRETSVTAGQIGRAIANPQAQSPVQDMELGQRIARCLNLVGELERIAAGIDGALTGDNQKEAEQPTLNGPIPVFPGVANLELRLETLAKRLQFTYGRF